MGWSNPDPYYQPEKFDLTPLGDLDDAGSYEFNIIAAWVHKDGTVYWATDSGCSCPSPFEDYNSLDQLEKLSDNVDYFLDKVSEWNVGEYERSRFINAVLSGTPAT